MINLSLARPVKIGVVEYAPHITLKNNSVSGDAIDYMNRILRNSQIKASFVGYPLKRAIRNLKQDDIDLLMLLGEESHGLKVFKRPMFFVVPGLCFKKENFIPILSAEHLYKDKLIAYPAGVKLVPTLFDSKAELKELNGGRLISRGLDMLKSNRIFAFYHPNPRLIYNKENPYYKDIACSYFYGHSTRVYIGISSKFDKTVLKKIEKSYEELLMLEPYGLK